MKLGLYYGYILLVFSDPGFLNLSKYVIERI